MLRMVKGTLGAELVTGVIESYRIQFLRMVYLTAPCRRALS